MCSSSEYNLYLSLSLSLSRPAPVPLSRACEGTLRWFSVFLCVASDTCTDNTHWAPTATHMYRHYMRVYDVRHSCVKFAHRSFTGYNSTTNFCVCCLCRNRMIRTSAFVAFVLRIVRLNRLIFRVFVSFFSFISLTSTISIDAAFTNVINLRWTN